MFQKWVLHQRSAKNGDQKLPEKFQGVPTEGGLQPPAGLLLSTLLAYLHSELITIITKWLNGNIVIL